jgi:hypothetical protein
MTRLTCASVRRRLSAFHDGETTPGERTAIHEHLQGCLTCATEAEMFQDVGDQLRLAMQWSRCGLDDKVSVKEKVVGQLQAERQQSALAQLGRLFEDLHLVWAGVGATMATVVCVAVMVGLLHFASAERGDSLAGVISALDYSTMELPRVDQKAIMPAILISDVPSDIDSNFTVAGIITREGRLTNLEMLATSDESAVAERLVLDDVRGARFVPAQVGGAPVAVNMVWMVTRMTVRGS